MLTAMGFSEKQAKDALDASGGEVESAVSWSAGEVAWIGLNGITVETYNVAAMQVEFILGPLVFDLQEKRTFGNLRLFQTNDGCLPPDFREPIQWV